ncbi:MAG TPA: hypothetical protein VFQ35_18165, partial [Polyangiaceae bacterium]|nr:hypothetical protein [Polyangiaceae bacterium]
VEAPALLFGSEPMLPAEHAAADTNTRRPANAFRVPNALIAVITVAQSIVARKRTRGSRFDVSELDSNFERSNEIQSSRRAFKSVICNPGKAARLELGTIVCVEP